MAWSKVSVKKFSLKDKSVRTRKVGQKTNKILNAKHLKVGTHCTSKNPKPSVEKVEKKKSVSQEFSKASEKGRNSGHRGKDQAENKGSLKNLLKRDKKTSKIPSVHLITSSYTNTLHSRRGQRASHLGNTKQS